MALSISTFAIQALLLYSPSIYGRLHLRARCREWKRQRSRIIRKLYRSISPRIWQPRNASRPTSQHITCGARYNSLLSVLDTVSASMKRFKIKGFTDNPPLHQFRRLLVRHSSVMESLRQEVRSVVGYVEHPTREQIRKMPYLAMVIKESTTSESCDRPKAAYPVQVSVSTLQSP